MLGKEVIKEELQGFVGEYVRVINLNKNKSGIYLLEIETSINTTCIIVYI